ncbi:MAG: tyrosine-type recombinase/integrase [Verrucomicrobiia bacterium]
MKLIRKDWPKVRVRIKHGRTYYEMDLRRKGYVGPKWRSFTDRKKALEQASGIAAKVGEKGLNSISITDVELAKRLTGWTEQCAVYGFGVEDAVKTAVVVWEKERQTKESPFIAELLTVWVDDKTTNTLKPLRPRSIKTIRNMAEVFKAEFGFARVKEITQERVEQFLSKKDCSNQFKENLRNYLCQFFNWAKAKRYHNENPAENIEISVVREPPKFFTVDQCERIMAAAMKPENRTGTAYFALCLFGGIRPDEVARMTWETNVKMDTKEISLQAAITKTKKDRLFQMSENLFQWLKFCDRTKSLMPDTDIKNLRTKVCEDLDFEWIPDGMRHSFATYHYAKQKSMELLRHEMGNSPGILDRFYKGAIAKAEVEKFWEITPEGLNEKKAKTA